MFWLAARDESEKLRNRHVGHMYADCSASERRAGTRIIPMKERDCKK